MSFIFNALLQFRDNASQALSRIQKKFQTLGNEIQKANASMAKVGQGMRGTALATAPLALGVGFATNEAMNFEAQMSTVQSVLLATKEEMKPLNAITKQLGATTAFTAEEAGQGAEALARAGFATKDIISALPGVLDAAAASGVSLGEAADVVANQIGAFGLQAKEATKVADTLALTTSLTNTDFTALAEGMKFAGATAKQAGMSLEETASTVGILANAGVKGSLAGTALKNALLQLSKPSKEALKLFGGKDGMDKALFRIVDGQKKLRPMEEIMANISIATSKAKDPLEAVNQAATILGLRGTTAMGAFSGQIQKSTKITSKNFEALQKGAEKTGEEFNYKLGDTIPTLLALRLQIAGAEGSARKMAKIKLDNLKGAFTLLGSAVSGISIEVGSLITGPLKRLVQIGTDFISVLTSGFQLLNANADESKVILNGLKDNQFKGLIDSMTEFARGFIEGFNEIKTFAIDTFKSIADFIKPILGDSNLTAKEIGKIVAKIIAVGAALAPVLAGFLAFGFVVGPILTGISGLVGLISSSFGILLTVAKWALVPLGKLLIGLSAPIWGTIGAIVAVGAAFWYFRDEVFSIIDNIAGYWNNFSEIFDSTMLYITNTAKYYWNEIVNFAINKFSSFSTWLMGWVNTGMGILKQIPDFIAFSFTESFNYVLNLGSTLLNGLVSIFKPVGKILFDILMSPFNLAISGIKSVILGLANTTIGSKALQLAGLDVTQLKSSLEGLSLGGTSPEKKVANEFAEENNKIQKESLKQTVITQPPSASENASAINNVIRPVFKQNASNNNVNVNLNGQFKLRGSDLLLSVSKSKVENSERNGRSLDPITKRRMVQNGESF